MPPTQDDLWSELTSSSPSLSKLTRIALLMESNTIKGEKCFEEILKMNTTPASLRAYASFLEVCYVGM